MVVDFDQLSCPDLAVSKSIIEHVVRIESSFNPYAIGVVGGRLERQPKNLFEAMATARMLEKRGYNFSLGLAQVNRYNLRKYGIHSYKNAFDACTNLIAGSRILAECQQRLGDWGKAFSCYYSGNSVTGFKHGYVQKVFASINANSNQVDDDLLAIAMIDNSTPAGAAKALGVKTASAVQPSLPARVAARTLAATGKKQIVSNRATAAVQTNATQAAIATAPGIDEAATVAQPALARPMSAKAVAAAKLAVAEAEPSKPNNAPSPESSGPDDAFVF